MNPTHTDIQTYRHTDIQTYRQNKTEKLTDTQKKLNMTHRNNELASDAAQELPLSPFTQQKLTEKRKKLNMRYRNNELASDAAQELPLSLSLIHISEPTRPY